MQTVFVSWKKPPFFLDNFLSTICAHIQSWLPFYLLKDSEPARWRAHNSSPHKSYCHFWDWHNWFLTLLIKLQLILVNFGTLNYWHWAQFTLKVLKFDISDLQNDWHLQLLIFGIFGTSCFWFLELFIFSMSDIKHDWYRTWLTLAYLILWISGIEHYQ